MKEQYCTAASPSPRDLHLPLQTLSCPPGRKAQGGICRASNSLGKLRKTWTILYTSNSIKALGCESLPRAKIHDKHHFDNTWGFVQLAFGLCFKNILIGLFCHPVSSAVCSN